MDAFTYHNSTLDDSELYPCPICHMWHSHREDQARHDEMVLRATVGEVRIDG